MNESTIEHHVIAIFREKGYTHALGPDMRPESYRKMCAKAIARLR